MGQEKNRAVFLDRDGTLMEDVGYPKSAEQVRLLPGVGPALRELHRLGFLLIIVSNQSGIGRGLITPAQADAVHGRLLDCLAECGVNIDAAHYCPHGPEDGCTCRKPAPGLLLRAAANTIDLRRSFMVGDRLRDTEAGQRAGCFSILLGSDGLREPGARPDAVARDWDEAATMIRTAGDP